MVLRLVLLSLRNLLHQPVRSLLILQGVIWGTALGILPPAVIHGSLGHVEEDAARLGTDRLWATQESVEATRRFTWEWLAALRAETRQDVTAVTGVGLLPEEEEGSLPLQLGDASGAQARALPVARGRFFTAEEVESGARVGVLTEDCARERFGAADPLGQTLVLRAGLAVEVVGVLAPLPEESLDPFGYNENHPLHQLVEQAKAYLGTYEDPTYDRVRRPRGALVPHTLFPEAAPRWIVLRAPPQHILALRDRLRAEWIAAGFEPVLYVNAALPVLYGETLRTAMELNHVVFLLCIFVGTSIVCATMMLAVLERSHEIAIRRVEGARRWHIALQFVVETGTVCAAGGILGVPLGLLLAMLRCWIEPLETITWAFPPRETAVVLLVVSAVGLIAGLLPAIRALRVDPVEVLRNA